MSCISGIGSRLHLEMSLLSSVVTLPTPQYRCQLVLTDFSWCPFKSLPSVSRPNPGTKFRPDWPLYLPSVDWPPSIWASLTISSQVEGTLLLFGLDMICHRLALGSQVCDISSNYQLFLNLIYNSRSESKTLIILTYSCCLYFCCLSCKVTCGMSRTLASYIIILHVDIKLVENKL